MNQDYEAKYHLFEDENWWFVARRDMVIRLLRGFDKRSSILEVGCSGGPLLRDLKARGFRNARGIDLSRKAVSLCRRQGLRADVMDASRPELSGRYDLIIASDILEHIKEDGLAVRNWHKLLKKGGRLIIFTPAHMFLWSRHDVANVHHRRYSLKDLKILILKAGFRVDKASYWNMVSFIPLIAVSAARKILRLPEKDHLHRPNRLANRMMTRALKLENRVVASLGVPFGVSAFLVATRIR